MKKSILILDASGVPVAGLETELSGFGGACGLGWQLPYHSCETDHGNFDRLRSVLTGAAWSLFAVRDS